MHTPKPSQDEPAANTEQSQILPCIHRAADPRHSSASIWWTEADGSVTVHEAVPPFAAVDGAGRPLVLADAVLLPQLCAHPDNIDSYRGRTRDRVTLLYCFASAHNLGLNISLRAVMAQHLRTFQRPSYMLPSTHSYRPVPSGCAGNDTPVSTERFSRRTPALCRPLRHHHSAGCRAWKACMYKETGAHFNGPHCTAGQQSSAVMPHQSSELLLYMPVGGRALEAC